ncbi:MAG: heme oxygenase [Dyadobacter sp. 50-39]|uniref:DUF3050 domain-containing protein n=1 Tax=Dyadobacter sp. 50-39 TaxID=1895756 RepID=UPI00096033A5|nr:DUF3050 domain-containing protein [Dyadobacter sp. 50-39]OJV21922.1 MAG: heme oxygenase [Dyadobacter sp. 50-39]
MNDHITRIQQNIEPLRQQIIQHKVYSVINDLDDLKVFMKYHVYAVWDFMSLLKSLQNSLTCTSVPWFPTGDGETRHLINEIVTGEESDVDMDGNSKSHFELYLDAMAQCGADITEITRFTETLRKTGSFQQAFEAAGTPEKAREFVNFTFETIGTGKSHLQAATFTFGREDLIPGMFMSIIEDIHKHFPDSISIFKYYLERHIEVDGDHHSHLALQMTANLCAGHEAFWQEAENATIASLEHRIGLWNGAFEEISSREAISNSLH